MSFLYYTYVHKFEYIGVTNLSSSGRLKPCFQWQMHLLYLIAIYHICICDCICSSNYHLQACYCKFIPGFNILGLCTAIYIHTYTYIYIYMYECVCVCVCVHDICMYNYVCVYVCICVYE